ncbi:hypothetical protein [Streptomyces canus]|uniref:hypothetical protein n=1 Tax=Streptomyces canus TaxID=58343 RepID=UPI0030E12C1D
MVEVVLAGVLGAAVLAIVLLYKSGQKQTARLTKLEADLAAEKIARITQQRIPLSPSVAAAEEEPQPARRKRHLALYLGGGVAAILASLGRLRAIIRGRRATVVTAAASSVLVATSAVAYYANAGSEAAPDPTSPAPSATAPGFVDSDAQSQPGADDQGLQGGKGETKGGPRNISSYKVIGSDAGEPPEATPGSEADLLGWGTETPAAPQAADKPATQTPTNSPEAPNETPPETTPVPVPSNPGPVKPAELTVGKVQRAQTDKRWCEDVTVEFRNTGGSPVTSGMVTFGTHIIDLFGTDWKTIKQTRELSTPIPAGGRVDHTWTLCVDSWRVPAGWLLETRDIAAALN